jgi:hypothetical protein
MKGNEILPHDTLFQDRFLTRRTVVFIFERDDLKFESRGDNYLFNYLNIHFKVELGRNISKTIINDVVTIYSFPYKDKGFTIDLVHINSYYIPVYKPFLMPFITESTLSLFMESLGCSSGIHTFSCDNMIMNYFTHFFICSGSQNNPWDTPVYKNSSHFLVNLETLRQRGNEDVYEFITTTLKSKSGKDKKETILAKSEEDPRYKKVIQFVGQPDLWTILEDESVALGSSVASASASSSGGTNGGKRRKVLRKTLRKKKKIGGRRTSRKH